MSPSRPVLVLLLSGWFCSTIAVGHAQTSSDDGNGMAGQVATDQPTAWTISLSGTDSPEGEGRSHNPSLPVAAVLEQNVLCLALPDRVLALDALTGRAAWPVDERDDGTIHRWQLASHGGEGGTQWPPTIRAVGNGLVIVMPAGVGSAVEERPSLVALDLKQGEGKLVWRLAADSPLSLEGWRRLGCELLVVGDRVWLPVQKPGRPAEVSLAILSATTGTLETMIPLVKSDQSQSASKGSLVHLKATEGRVAAGFANRLTVYDAVTFSPLWKHEISSAAEAGAMSSLTEVEHLLVTARSVVVGTADGSMLVMNAQDGVERWRHIGGGPISEILPLGKNQLLFARRGLQILDELTGQIDWQWWWAQNTQNDSGALLGCGDCFCWMTPDDLWIINAQTRSVRSRIRQTPAATDDSVGSLWGLSDGQGMVYRKDGNRLSRIPVPRHDP